ncbi:flagellar hook assembly protein FlgD [Chungangia koreensis]|uniref:Basal-body rod modification protein FlgD n=1 Tax=Chungangia koreensis TaxID=752657 RepID=A0ABV8X1K2_9LACT
MKPITSNMYLANNKKQERQTGNSVLGKDDFMKLLITQLQNQDPTNPMKDTEFIAQMAQFSSLEQMTNMGKAFEKFAEGQQQMQLIQYNSFVGKTINWHELTDKLGEDGKPVVNEGTGKIVSAKFIDGTVKFILEDGKELTPGNVSEVLAGSGSANSLVEASLLIGKKVTYMDDETEMSGTVQSVANKAGKIEYVLTDGKRLTADQFLMISQ